MLSSAVVANGREGGAFVVIEALIDDARRENVFPPV